MPNHSSSETPLIISASMLRWVILCDRRLWLDAHGDRSERDEVAPIQAFSRLQGINHEDAVQQSVAPQARPVPVQTWSEGVEQTRLLMEQGVMRIGQGYLEVPLHVDSLPTPILARGKVDWLERHNDPTADSTGTPRWVYSPREIKVYQTLTDADRVQLDLYVWMLMKLQDTDAVSPEFWLRGKDGALVERLPHNFDELRLRNALEQVARLLVTTIKEPEVVLKPICHQCHWRSFCRRIVEARLDVTILPKLSKKTREHFRAEGITTLTQVAAMAPDELRRFKGIKTTAEGIRAHAEALISKTPVWYGSLPDHVANGGWMFDIETIMPDNKEVWSIGWSGTDGSVRIVVVNSEVSPEMSDAYSTLNLPNEQAVFVVPDAATAWRVFADAVDDARPIFHWSPFDNGVMKNNAPDDVRTRLDGRLFDLCHLFDKFVKCPIRSLSLKTVAPFVTPGFGWDAQGDAFTAYVNYSQWLKTGNLQTLASAYQYQGDDVRALLFVWQWLTKHRPAPDDKSS